MRKFDWGKRKNKATIYPSNKEIWQSVLKESRASGKSSEKEGIQALAVAIYKIGLDESKITEEILT